MDRVVIPEPVSGGLILSYKCSSNCRHCLYACSPTWNADWLPPSDAEAILRQLAPRLRCRQAMHGIGVNEGMHFTGGEPFLNFSLLLEVTSLARRLGIRSTFVETNSIWCMDDDTTEDRLMQLRDAGLEGILISTNPFVVEHVPFERTERAVRISARVFPGNVLVYQAFFYDQFRRMGLRDTLPFGAYLARAGEGLYQAELLAGGRVAYKLGHLLRKQPADRFLSGSCQRELIRDWHIHVDNYCNFVPGYCAGVSLGDARELDKLCEGIDLAQRPVLHALLMSLESLYELGLAYGYQPQGGYVSKCHLCIDIRRHLARLGQFEELRPTEFYEHLED